MTDKEQVIALYPDAKCISYIGEITKERIYKIFAEGDVITLSYTSEAVAWQYALSITNRKILHKLEDN
jgi:hypothetical protein